MSEYQVHHPSLYIIVGYDSSIHSLFATVKDPDVPDLEGAETGRSHEETLLELGTEEGEIPDVETLVEALNPYVDMPKEVVTELRYDLDGTTNTTRFRVAVRDFFNRVVGIFSL